MFGKTKKGTPLTDEDVHSWWFRCSEYRQKEAAKDLKLHKPDIRHFAAKANRKKVEGFIKVNAGQGSWPALYAPEKEKNLLTGCLTLIARHTILTGCGIGCLLSIFFALGVCAILYGAARGLF